MINDDPKDLETTRKLWLSCNKHLKQFTTIGAARIYRTEHSVRNSVQNSKRETAQMCLHDSGGTNVTGARLPYQTEFLQTD
jgi:hypothetical protein